MLTGFKRAARDFSASSPLFLHKQYEPMMSHMGHEIDIGYHVGGWRLIQQTKLRPDRTIRPLSELEEVRKALSQRL